MTLTRSYLLGQLQDAVSEREWDAIANDRELPISGFNREILSELRYADIKEEKVLQEDAVSGLRAALERFLEEHLKDKPEGRKWVIISCLYLTFIAKRPMHPIDSTGIKISTADGKTIYECPLRSNGEDAVCRYCVCRKMSNYEIMKRQMQKEFLKYDQEKMIQKFQLDHDPEYIYIRFLERSYRICRADGKVSWSADDPADGEEASYNEAMTIYDVLCYPKEDCRLSGEFVSMQSLSSVHGSSHSLGNGFFQKIEEEFDHKGEILAGACEKLNGIKTGKGDIAYQIPLFDFLPVQIQFWDSDDEFPASLQIFTDKNMLDYMHYETVWFAVSHLLDRIKEGLR